MIIANSSCEDCTFHNVNNLKKLGIDTSNIDSVIALQEIRIQEKTPSSML